MPLSQTTTRRAWAASTPLTSTLTARTSLDTTVASEDAEQTHHQAIMDNLIDASFQHDLQEDPSEQEVPRLDQFAPGTVSTTGITTITITTTTFTTLNGKTTSNTSTKVNTTHLDEAPLAPALNRRTPSVLTPREDTIPCEDPSVPGHCIATPHQDLVTSANTTSPITAKNRCAPTKESTASLASLRTTLRPLFPTQETAALTRKLLSVLAPRKAAIPCDCRSTPLSSSSRQSYLYDYSKDSLQS
jgi:hypothetical protein